MVAPEEEAETQIRPDYPTHIEEAFLVGTCPDDQRSIRRPPCPRVAA